jgi:ABC-type hemin transport system ATPase subunit
MMKAENLSVHRDGKCVLADIDLTLNPGEMLGVLGRTVLARAPCWVHCVES